MRLEPETRRRLILPLLAGALLVAYLFVFVPLDRKSAKLDVPLDQAWRKLANLMGHTNALKLDFFSLTNQFAETRSAITAFESARNQARQRVELDETLRANLSAPFQLVEYDNEAGRLMGVLGRLAKQQKVVLEPAALSGFPAQTAQALLHIILSHHGALEHGSPVVPATREATLVHMLDNLGGRLGSFDRLEKQLAPGAVWSTFDRALNGGAFFGPATTDADVERAAA